MKEEDIRPNEIFQKFLSILSKDSKKYFQKLRKKKSLCLACSKKTIFLYKKNNFKYDKCIFCNTIFANPRPFQNDLNNFYRNSDSSKFWSSDFYKKTEKNRKKFIWKNKALNIFKILKKFKKNKYDLVDIGGGYGLFVDEFSSLSKNINISIIEPSIYLSQILEKKGYRVINKFLEQVQYKELNTTNNTLFTCFELFEHVLNPNTFLKKIYNLMKRNDIFVLTTLSGTGLDIISLGKKSNSISPPQHLNFFNPFSIELLLKKNHFKIVSVSTPGKLDISILENNRNYVKDEFIKNLLEQSPIIKNNFQKFISNNNLSSHMMVVCKK